MSDRIGYTLNLTWWPNITVIESLTTGGEHVNKLHFWQALARMKTHEARSREWCVLRVDSDIRKTNAGFQLWSSSFFIEVGESKL